MSVQEVSSAGAQRNQNSVDLYARQCAWLDAAASPTRAEAPRTAAPSPNQRSQGNMQSSPQHLSAGVLAQRSLGASVQVNTGSRGSLTPAALFESTPNSPDAPRSVTGPRNAEMHASDLQRSLGKVQSRGEHDLDSNVGFFRALPARVSGFASLPSIAAAATAAFDTARPAAPDEAAVQSEFAALAMCVARQKARHAGSGLLLDAAKTRTSLVDLQDLRAAQQRVVDVLAERRGRPGTLVDAQALMSARADLHATDESLHQARAMLDSVLERLRKLTFNRRLGAHRIPTLRDDNDAAPLAALTSAAEVLCELLPETLQAAIETNPEIAAMAGALQHADSRLSAVEAKVADGLLAPSIAGDIAAFVFAGPIGSNLGMALGSALINGQPVSTQLTGVRDAIETARQAFGMRKARFADEIRARADALLSRSDGSAWHRGEISKAAVKAASRACRELEAQASRPDSTVTAYQLSRAHVHYLEQRFAQREAAGESLAAMNRMVYLTGGFADTASEAFKAFDAGFSARYR